MNIKVLIAEDEKLARQELEYLLRECENVSLCPSAVNGRELLEKVDEYQPDLIFLDIEMPELVGTEAAKKLRKLANPPLIIFTTAYDQYAVEAFDLDAVDYLLKPYSEERFEEALAKVFRKLQKKNDKAEPASPATKGQSAAKMSKLLLDDGNRLSVVDPRSIYYVMREERIVRIFTKDTEYESKLTLQELEEKLAPFHFFRSHRSYLVNLDYIEEIIPWFNRTYNLRLKDFPKAKVPVSRTAAKELMELLQM